MEREQEKRPSNSGLTGGLGDQQRQQYKEQPLLAHREEI